MAAPKTGTDSHIVIKNKEAGRLFSKGSIVFKIAKRYPSTPDGEYIDYWMVTTKEEYEAKLSSHDYISILYIAPLTYKLAYLYGCLNRKRGISRAETFIFLYREIGKHDWIEWFIINPYKD
jgi:hypothetical protein